EFDDGSPLPAASSQPFEQRNEPLSAATLWKPPLFWNMTESPTSRFTVDGLNDIPDAVTTTVFAHPWDAAMQVARRARAGRAMRRAWVNMINASARQGTPGLRAPATDFRQGRRHRAGQSLGPHERLSSLTKKARSTPTASA